MPAGWGRRLPPALLTACALIGGGTIQASSFGILPVQIFLSPRSPRTVLSLHNQDREPLRLQLSAYVWDQDARGEVRLAPTDDVIFFPRLFSIAPGEKRNVRVGVAAAAFAEKERTYRLIVQELGPLARQEERRIRMLTRLSLPVFLQPTRPLAKAQVERVAVDGHRLRVAVRNLGNVHVQPLGVQLLSGAAGRDPVEIHLPATYVLAGDVRELDVAIPRGQCVERGAATVEVRTRGEPLRQEVDLTERLCGG